MPEAPTPLKSQDLVLLLWVSLRRGEAWRRVDAARVLDLSPSMITYATQRLRDADALTESERVRAQALDELLPAVRWIYPAARERPPGHGMPTAHAAPGVDLGIGGRPYVWEVPARGGPVPSTEWVEGNIVTPLHPCAPVGSARDADLYRALALLDAVRVGGPRLRKAALRELRGDLGLTVSR